MKWAIIGTGNITHQFARDSSLVDHVDIVAVCSRRKESGDKFAKEFGIAKVYTDYDDLLNSEEIDNIYVGIPHPNHKEVVNYFLAKGKNVLCEKPLGVNKEEVQSMIKTAKDNNCLLMEAMWSLFFPSVIKTKALLSQEHFGKINSIAGYIGFGSGGSHDQWRYKNAMAGGALLDVGIYPIHFFLHIFDAMPTEYTGLAHVQDGVDLTEKVLMDFGGTLASFDASIVNTYPCGYDIYCEKGSIHLDLIIAPSTLTLKPMDGPEEVIDFSFKKGGMQYEIQAFDDATQKGLKELAPLSHDRTLAVIEIMDGLRNKWQLVYPSDQTD